MKHCYQYFNGRFEKSTTSKIFEILNSCAEEVLPLISMGYFGDANKVLEAEQKAHQA